LACLALGILVPGAAHASSNGAKTVLVRFEAPATGALEVLAEGDVPLGRTLTGVQLVGLGPGESVREKLAEYESRPDVLYAEPDPIARATLAGPLDPRLAEQWALGSIHAVQGWSIFPGSYAARGGATIAVLDTGVDATHEDLNDGRVLSGVNCLNATGTCLPGSTGDDNGHGTMVAGVAAAAANNNTGIAGTAFSSSVLPVKVLDSAGRGSYSAITNGIVWAASQGARVINLSLGGFETSDTLCDAVTRARMLGAVVVVAAGNEASQLPMFPAACPGAVGVAATDGSDRPASFSNFGAPNVFVAAPGVSVVAPHPGNTYALSSGTSIAAGYVSALSALLFTQSPGRSGDEVKGLLATTADKAGGIGYAGDPYGACAGCTWSATHGYGRINIERALAVSAPRALTPAAPAVSTPKPRAPKHDAPKPHLPDRAAAVSMTGGAGPDVVQGGHGDDRLSGGAGADVLLGGPGNDRINGGRGRDRLSGQGGDDIIRARDGAQDVVSCGPGRDTVFADRLDKIASGCETVMRAG